MLRGFFAALCIVLGFAMTGFGALCVWYGIEEAPDALWFTFSGMLVVVGLATVLRGGFGVGRPHQGVSTTSRPRDGSVASRIGT